MKMLRSFVFVSADSSKTMTKARTVSPDALIFDLEDGVAADHAVQGRSLLLAELDTLPSGSATISVRINGYRSRLWEDDVFAAVHPKVVTFELPTCEGPGEIVLICEAITELEKMASFPRGQIHLHLAVETSLSTLRLQELARVSDRANGQCFGSEDSVVDMRVSRKYKHNEILTPKSLTAVTAHASHLDVIGGDLPPGKLN